MRAFKLINKNFKNINLVLVGIEKNNIFRIKKEIENLNLNNNVFIIGYVSNKDIYSFYKNALILIGFST